MNDSVYEGFRERYRAGGVPWDAELPPPEVMDLAESLPPGRALDLGCGYGRSAIYLAQRGWQVDGVDFVAEAVAEAQRRAMVAGCAPRFHAASVTDLSFLVEPVDWVIDVGCLHSLSPVQAEAYRAELWRLLKPGGRYLLFARLAQQAEEKGMAETAVHELFDKMLVLDKKEVGETATAVDQPAWRSAWFWWRRV